MCGSVGGVDQNTTCGPGAMKKTSATAKQFKNAPETSLGRCCHREKEGTKANKNNKKGLVPKKLPRIVINKQRYY